MSRVGNGRVAASGARADTMHAVERLAGFSQSFRAVLTSPRFVGTRSVGFISGSARLS